jgi:hypothetical protein
VADGWQVCAKTGWVRSVAVTCGATVGSEVTLLLEESALGILTVRAGKPSRMQVTPQTR